MSESSIRNGRHRQGDMGQLDVYAGVAASPVLRVMMCAYIAFPTGFLRNGTGMTISRHAFENSQG